MIQYLPGVLTRVRQGICPTCGAPMPLAESGRTVECGFCGGESSLDYRLRVVEPGAGGLDLLQMEGAEQWAELLGPREPCTCPGCGDVFTPSAWHAILTCDSCGMQSRIEARLLPITAKDVEPPKERTRLDHENQRRDRIDYPFDIETEQLIWRILNEPDLLGRINLARNFRRWSYINHTAVHFLPWLLEQIQKDDEALAIKASDVIGKLLCQGDKTLWPGVLLACQGAVFDVKVKRSILSELGLGKGVCLKTLIDAAEYAASQGDRDTSCHALWGANWLIGRNFDEHETIAKILLYRLFYVTGPVLGWTLNALRHGDLYGRYPIEVLVRAIDELGEERPEVVPHLLDCLYVGPPETPAEFRRRMGFVTSAIGWGGRAAGFEILRTPPDADPESYSELVAEIDASLDHPRAGDSAERLLYRLICDGKETTAAPIDELVARRGESLTYRVKREFIRRHPDTPLLDTSEPYYWQSEPEREMDPEMQRLIDDWNEGIRAAVGAYEEVRREARPLLDQAEKLDLPVFLQEEPATIPVPDDRNEELIEAREQEEQENLLSGIQELQRSYMERIQALSQKMTAEMNDPAAIQRYSDEMTRLGAELQEKMEELTGG